MKNPAARARRQKPLLDIRGPLRARVYRAKFRPFESTRYLDAKAIKAARKATIECGTLEVAGLKQTVAVEIRRGMIAALRPVGCEGCGPAKPRKMRKAAFTQTLQAVGQAMRERGISPPTLPAPVRISARQGLEIPLPPIVIIIGDPAPGGFDVCLVIWIDERTQCWWCIFGGSGCMTLG